MQLLLNTIQQQDFTHQQIFPFNFIQQKEFSHTHSCWTQPSNKNLHTNKHKSIIQIKCFEVSQNKQKIISQISTTLFLINQQLVRQSKPPDTIPPPLNKQQWELTEQVTKTAQVLAISSMTTSIWKLATSIIKSVNKQTRQIVKPVLNQCQSLSRNWQYWWSCPPLNLQYKWINPDGNW